MKHIEWKNHTLYLLDQRKLPLKTEFVPCKTVDDVCDMIVTLGVRGAPAIGVAGIFALVIAAYSYKEKDGDFQAYMQRNQDHIASTRPTAVNLFWALEEMKPYWQNNAAEAAPKAMEKKAFEIWEDDIRRCTSLSKYGASLIPMKGRILTHCNAGSLATGGVGTALGFIEEGFHQGKVEMVFADETRPLLQGARLTAYELMEKEIPVTLITDSMAAAMMAQGEINMVVTGADRIAANGDTANKIGTYGIAVLAKYHGIPFYVTAPLSTFDLTTATGRDIIIEERDEDEVRSLYGMQIAPINVPVRNPAFDVTPHSLITAIITEKGILRGDYKTEIEKQMK